MAQYYCTTRTNYFRVKDEDAFNALMARVYTGEDAVSVWTKEDEDGIKRFAFGCHDSISGVANSQDDEDPDADEASYDEFVSELQKVVDPEDAIIIMETGHQKLQFVAGDATIVTSDAVKYISLREMAIQIARGLLQNPEWKTTCEY